MTASFFQDMHYALRQLRKSPGFAFTVVLTLALSVGVATAVFCVIDAVILRPLPFADPDRIAFVNSKAISGYTQPASWPSFQDERAQAQGFEALAAYSDFKKISMDVAGGSPAALDCVRSTDNFFRVFGVQPILGRTYLPGEEKDGKNDVAVLSYEVWQNYFAGDRNVVNKSIKLDGHPFTVIGVMPAGFRYPLNKREAVYIPRLVDEAWMQRRGAHWLRTIGRLKDGYTMERAQVDLVHVFSNIGKTYADSDGGRTVRLQPLAQSVNERSNGPLWTLLGAVLAVLAIGCVNVAGLLLARGVKREREMAMRTAIGAGRGRLVRQLLTEGVFMAMLGAAGGVVLSSALLNLMRAFLIKALARGADIHLNWVVLAAAVAIAVVTSLAASLLPAVRLSGVSPVSALKAGGSAGTQRGQHRLRSGFIVTQVALTLVLLVVSGLLLRVISRYRHADLGFDPSRVITFRIGLTRATYQNRDVLGDFYKPLEERVSHLPGVQAAGLIDILPIESWGNNSDIHIAGQPPYPKNQEMLAENRRVSAGYFDVVGVPLRAGRKLSPRLDRTENTAPTVIVNDALVHKFIPAGLDPTVQRFDDADKQEDWTKIVGVMGNIRQNIYDPPMAEFDWLMDEIPLKQRTDAFADMTLMVRTSGDPAQIVPAVRSIVHDLDSTIPFREPRTMNDVVAETLVFERMESWLFGIFAGLALALAMVGLYGLVSQEVEQTTCEIGVRMALGASRNRILSMVITRVTWMLGAGAVAGLALTMMTRKVIDMVIYFEVKQEAGGFVLLALLLIVAGLLAALIPAMRAASIEPMQALRSE
jgi:putative ABC transport system permease protein